MIQIVEAIDLGYKDKEGQQLCIVVEFSSITGMLEFPKIEIDFRLYNRNEKKFKVLFPSKGRTELDNVPVETIAKGLLISEILSKRWNRNE